MNVVISIEDEVKYFFDSINDLIAHCRLTGGISIFQAMDIVIVLMDDIINGRMLWAGRSHQYEKVMEDRFRWFNERGIGKPSEKILDISDELEFMLRVKVEAAIPHRTWQWWTVKHLTELDVSLCQEIDGQDYRVYDWMQRHKRGEF